MTLVSRGTECYFWGILPMCDFCSLIFRFSSTVRGLLWFLAGCCEVSIVQSQSVTALGCPHPSFQSVIFSNNKKRTYNNLMRVSVLFPNLFVSLIGHGYWHKSDFMHEKTKKISLSEVEQAQNHQSVTLEEKLRMWMSAKFPGDDNALELRA